MPPRTRRTAPAKTKLAAVPDEVDELEEDEVEETPAPAPRRRRVAKKPVEVVEEDDDDLEEDDEEPAPVKKPVRRRRAADPVVEDDEDEDDEPVAPVKKRAPAKAAVAAKAKPAAEAPQFGTAWLAEHIEAKTGKAYSPYDIRALLRKLAKNGTIDREVGVERARYSFKGAKDPVVVELIGMVNSGEIEAAKKASLDKLKEKAAAKAPAKKAAAPAKRTRAKAKPAPVEDDEDVEELDDDFDELDD